jgi:hypothetical protein
MNVKQQFLEDKQGQKIAVVLPIEVYNHMLEELEEYADIKAYDMAKSENQTFRSLKEALVDIEKERQK